MKNKNLLKIVIAVIIVSMLSLTVSAHPSSQEGILAKTQILQGGYNGNYYIGGDDVGWSIDEDVHTNGTSTTFSFANDSNLTTAHRNYTTSGAAFWSSVVAITQVSSGGVGTIRTEYNTNSNAAATFYEKTTNSSGHLTKWEIVINRYNNQYLSAKVMAHEFGHAIGLNDLYASKSSNKLMYGYTSTTATSATSSDLWGARVITGQHTTHSWGYKYKSSTASGNSHIKYCTSCNGLTTVIEGCTYNAKNICMKCKTPKGSSVQSVDEEIELLLN